jgi:hypothetical protein
MPFIVIDLTVVNIRLLKDVEMILFQNVRAAFFLTRVIAYYHEEIND